MIEVFSLSIWFPVSEKYLGTGSRRQWLYNVDSQQWKSTSATIVWLPDSKRVIFYLNESVEKFVQGCTAGDNPKKGTMPL